MVKIRAGAEQNWVILPSCTTSKHSPETNTVIAMETHACFPRGISHTNMPDCHCTVHESLTWLGRVDLNLPKLVKPQVITQPVELQMMAWTRLMWEDSEGHPEAKRLFFFTEKSLELHMGIFCTWFFSHFSFYISHFFYTPFIYSLLHMIFHDSFILTWFLYDFS